MVENLILVVVGLIEGVDICEFGGQGCGLHGRKARFVKKIVDHVEVLTAEGPERAPKQIFIAMLSIAHKVVPLVRIDASAIDARGRVRGRSFGL